jgi:hypothetical protein
MYNLISIAMLAFVGFAPLAATAPTHMGMNEVAAASSAMPGAAAVAWNSEQSQHDDVIARSNHFIEAAIAQALAEHRGTIMKRATTNGDGQDAPVFDLSAVFRGLFDNVVNYIIQVTPLNDIVHGNYDLLYDIFLTKVDELFSGMGAPNTTATPTPTPVTTSNGTFTKDGTSDVSSKTNASADVSDEDDDDYTYEGKNHHHWEQDDEDDENEDEEEDDE